MKNNSKFSKQFQVKLHPTIKKFEEMKYLPREVFLETAKARFGLLDADYVQRKFEEERFPVQGNRLLSQYLAKYLKTNSQVQNKKKLVLLDIGSAGGALTTLFALDTLDKFGLLKKTRIILVDVAKDALRTTLAGNFFLPPKLIKVYKLERFGKNGDGFRKILARQAEYYCSDISNLPAQIKNVDFCLSGFTHHHLTLKDKHLACRQMEKVTISRGFIGVVDESLTYKDYLAWLKAHANEKNSRGKPVPLAQESFIELPEHKNFFKNTDVRWETSTRNYYCFGGVSK